MAMDTTEIYRSSAEMFFPGTPLIQPRAKACLGQIDSNSFLLSGGLNEDGDSVNTFWRFDIDMDVWEDLPASNVPRNSHICGYLDLSLIHI